MQLQRPELQVVGFDLDGTLVDSVGDIAAALNAALSEMELAKAGVDVVRTFVGNGARVLVRRALAHAGGDPALEDLLLARFSGHYENALVGETVAYPGVAEMLAALQGKAKLAVATNKPGAFARSLVDALFPGVFDVVIGPDDAGALKPDPAILRAVEAKANAKLVAFVGDSGVDVETAKNAGVPALGVGWGLKPAELAGADRVVATAPELAAALLALVAAALPG